MFVCSIFERSAGLKRFAGCRATLVLVTLVCLVGLSSCDPERNPIPGGVPTCVIDEIYMNRVPVDLFLIVDRSGSMGGLWSGTVNALSSFFNDARSSGISVGMNLFPKSSSSLHDCDPANYNPVQTPGTGQLAILPTESSTLISALSVGTGGGTPMYGALDGSYAAAIAHQAANPNHVVVIVFTSDGAPGGGCDSHYGSSGHAQVDNISQLAANTYANHGIETYCIIIDPSAEPALSAIAAQGGTVQAYDVSNDISLFAQKMDDIRVSVIEEGCDYVMPEVHVPASQTFDPLLINLYLTPSNSPKEVVPMVNNAGECGATNGWYYDNIADPASITLCSHSCHVTEFDPGARLTLIYGCDTELK